MVDVRTLGKPTQLLRSANRESVTIPDDELTNPWIAGAAVLLLLLLPLVPVLLAGWTIARTLRGVRRRVSWD